MLKLFALPVIYLFSLLIAVILLLRDSRFLVRPRAVWLRDSPMRSRLKKMCRADNPNPSSLNFKICFFSQQKNGGMSIVSICILYICWRVLYIFLYFVCITDINLRYPNKLSML